MNAVVQIQGRQSLQPQTFEQMMKYAEVVAKSELVPKDYQGKPHNCLIAMQWASELGMNPLQGLQNIAVINGRPSLWGDMLPALVKNHPSYMWMEESLEYDEKNQIVAAVCTGQRKGHPNPETRRFSITDAAKANLWGKSGPWSQYPQRMLQMRARAWLCRDLWADALRGLAVAEEVQDIEVIHHKKDPALPSFQETVEKYGEDLALLRENIDIALNPQSDDAAKSEALDKAVEIYFGVGQDNIQAVWIAPTKCEELGLDAQFTTKQRGIIKSNEWAAAKNKYFANKKEIAL